MEISLSAETLFHIGSFPVTNTLIMALCVSGLLISASIFVKNKLALIPRGLQNILEFVVEAVLDLVDSVTQDRKQSEQFFPLIATIFLFVIMSNWIELIPGLGTIGLHEVKEGKTILIPFIRSASADLNVSAALAIISVITVQVTGIMALGFFKYAGKFFISPFKKPYGIGTFVGLLEFIGEIAKLISYSFRLFGNIFAGEVLLAVMLMLVPYLVPIPFLALEIFVGFIQALVFSMLTLVFLKMAVTEAAH
jgi:F-type H+-transporting ATPase subunit a